MISVNIISDDTSEAPETFYGRISVVDSMPSNVHLEPLRAEVTIIDMEGMKLIYEIKLNVGILELKRTNLIFSLL